MYIRAHFQSEVITTNGVDLTEEEGRELGEVLDNLIALQDTEPYTEDKARELAALAFVAGRSNQKEKDQQEHHGLMQRLSMGTAPGTVTPSGKVRLELSMTAIENMLQYTYDPEGGE